MRFLLPILLVCLFTAPTTCALPTPVPPQHPQHPHSPPWNSPVAWSQTIRIGGATIRIDIAPGPLDLPHAPLVQWIDTAARAVSAYYGRFPVSRARVLVVPAPNLNGVLAGTTWGGVGRFPAFTRIRLGQHTTAQQLADDWTATHEFVHTALPSLTPDHHWLEEGLATYVEPIARAQIGTLTPAYVWKETVQGMPKGEPHPGQQGLDQTHSWAATYWGGALFCLLADVAIRRQTNNRKGLQDALRGILAAGGSIAVDWPIAKVLAVADQATGTTVLADLYRKMGKSPYAPIDLDALWQRLGIRIIDGQVIFDSNAPLAPVREAITAPRLFLHASQGTISGAPGSAHSFSCA